MRVVGETGVGCRGATRPITAFFCLFIGATVVAMAQERSGAPTPSTPGAEVYFVDIKDGDAVSTKLKVHFGLKNMGVAPAGSDRPNSRRSIGRSRMTRIIFTSAPGKRRRTLPCRPASTPFNCCSRIKTTFRTRRL